MADSLQVVLKYKGNRHSSAMRDLGPPLQGQEDKDWIWLAGPSLLSFGFLL